MCDLLAISAGFNYTPREYLPLFAERGKRNVSGWGIGFFREGQALVEKSGESVYQENQMHDSFQRLARVIDSQMILAHISCPLIGGRHGQGSHPFSLSFLGHSWLFIHLGNIRNIETYPSQGGSRLDSDVPSARVFEFLRDHMVKCRLDNPHHDLLTLLALATKDLIATYPGHYNYFLANESVLFAFFNYRQLVMLKEQDSLGNILLLTSLEDGLSNEGWRNISLEGDSAGKFVVIGGAELLYQKSL